MQILGLFKRPFILLRGLAVAGVLASGGVAFASFSSDSAPTYLVVPGDTLWGISHRFGVDMYQLAADNSMDVNDLLLAGRTLVLPTSGSTSTSASATSASVATSATTTASTASASAPTESTNGLYASQQSFCSTFSPQSAPVGQLPWLLQVSPDRLALRPIFVQWAEADGIPASLVEAIAWQESGWQQNVVSNVGAVGVGQLMPDTATFVSQQLIGSPLQVNDVNSNIEMSARLLAYLYQSTGGNLCETVAAYYQGLGMVRTYGVIPDSQVYVENVLALRPRFEVWY